MNRRPRKLFVVNIKGTCIQRLRNYILQHWLQNISSFRLMCLGPSIKDVFHFYGFWYSPLSPSKSAVFLTYPLAKFDQIITPSSLHFTEVRFASFLSGGFTNMAVINPPERKVAKRTSVHFVDVFYGQPMQCKTLKHSQSLWNKKW